ncbi:MAG: hypothetical protein LXA50_17710, partial [Betaproteobacteria bacterium]|nr:hypothetical protein [Betaproteobacteria bacterium]
MRRALRLRPARCPIPMHKDAHDHPGVLDARHDLLPRHVTRARFDLDAEYPLQTLRPAQRHMAGQPRPLRALLRAALLRAVAALATTGRREQRQPILRQRRAAHVPAQPLELRALPGPDRHARVQREPARLRRSASPFPLALRGHRLQREHLLPRARTRRDAPGDAMTEQLIERSGLHR